MLLPTLTSFLAFASLATSLETSDENNSPAQTLEEPQDGYVVGHPFPACNGRRLRKPLAIPVDRCMTSPGMGLVITQAGVCSNGTRAKWARFPDKKCGRGTIDVAFGLVDLLDSDLNKCLDTGYLDAGNGDHKNMASMAFWCDGVKKTSPEDDPPVPEKPKEKKGSVSESACMADRAPFFNHPNFDTCVNLKTEKMQIYSAAVCTNGTQSTMALYRDAGCAGSPNSFMEVTKEKMNKCLDFAGTKSFAFYCTGNITVPNSGNNGAGNGNSGGSVLHFFLILALICLMFFLMLVLSVLAWVRKYGGGVGKLIDFFSSLFKPKDGGIAL